MEQSPTDPKQSRTDDTDHAIADSERAATHDASEDVSPGVIKDGHGEVQPDPYPDRPEDAGNTGPDRRVIEQHRADAHHLEHHRTAAGNETLGTVADPDEGGADGRNSP